jgi:hypothetical protein
VDATVFEDMFSSDARSSVDALTAAGFIVIDYPVCSSSVGDGEVRQVIRSVDGVVLLDKEGPTPEAGGIEIGTAIEVKVGNGYACG